MWIASARRLFQNFQVLFCPPTACSLPRYGWELGTSHERQLEKTYIILAVRGIVKPNGRARLPRLSLGRQYFLNTDLVNQMIPSQVP
jgi:hypothetical protein